ncbi:MAG TPA: ammonium transporter [Candidatus Brocadiia bacterium]|nr:ammonium transporter [Candidatus Brocadiia bacterium]
MSHLRRLTAFLFTTEIALCAMAAQDLAADNAAPAQTVASVASLDSGDTAWVLISAALVLLMTPGLAFFYGGLVRKKNVLSVLMQCLMMIGLITIHWVICGYSLAFGPDIGGVIGGLDWAGLRGVTGEPGSYAPTIPHNVFMIYQAMFAVITPALIIGAFAERMRFSSFCVFSLLWATFVYAPVCHWVWGEGGFLRKMGALDFAGGTVVHINAGLAALAAALILGKRHGFTKTISPPHSLPFAVLGASLLWFGWFGFNAGSALSAGGLAGSAFVATHVAASTAAFAWAILDSLHHSRPTALGIITGAVAGLVAVTPAAGFITPLGAMGIGLSVSIICWLSVTYMKPLLGYDDSLDAYGVHGVGGIWGAIATGLWASKAVNPAGADGLFHGNPALLVIQLKAVAVTAAYAFVCSCLLLKLVNLALPLRVSEREERVGLDLSLHSEAAYTLID